MTYKEQLKVPDMYSKMTENVIDALQIICI
jgi:hypothetical protein